MSKRIRISWDTDEVFAVLEDTPTARKLLEALPCVARANTWGEEVYFELPVAADLEPDARQVVDRGDGVFLGRGAVPGFAFRADSGVGGR